MCTVSFIARKRGYALAMNRDEKLSRVAGLPPKISVAGGRKIISPSEPGGGTWIAVNDTGATFALINRYSITARVRSNPVSRGGVVKVLRALADPSSADARFGELPLKRMNAFRLIGFFPRTKEIIEWRWNLQKLFRKAHRWQAQQWISSGHDEPKAQKIRGATFRAALRQKPAGTLAWLRRLHRSHAPERGPFSTCMHRADAATVSCTEVSVSAGVAVMKYHASAPCEAGAVSKCRMKLDTAKS